MRLVLATSDLLLEPAFGDWTGLEGAGHGQRAEFSLCVMPELAFQDTWKGQPDCRDRWGMDEVLPLWVIMRLFSVCQLRNN